MKAAARIPLLVALCAIAALVVPGSAFGVGLLSSLGAEGEGAGEFGGVEDVAIAPDGSAYVAESDNNRISVFGPGGEFRFAFGKDVNATTGTPNDDVCTAASGCIRGRSVSDAGGLREPVGVALGPDGNVFAVSPLNGRVDVFSPDGRFLYAFGKEVNATAGAANPNLCTAQSGCKFGRGVVDAGSVSNPKGVAVSGGRVYVVSNAQRRVDVFSEAGQFLFGFGKDVNAAANPADPDVCNLATNCKDAGSEGPGALQAPRHIAVAEGRVYVVSETAHKVGVFSTEGQFLFDFGTRATLLLPVSVAVSTSGDVYVGDESDRISVFSRDGVFLRALGLGVADGAPNFQECVTAAGCRAANKAPLAPGSLEQPKGLGFDPTGALYVAESALEKDRVERFDVRPPPPPPAPQRAKPSNLFALGKLKLDRQRGIATLTATLPGPGTVSLAGKGLRMATAVAPKAGAVRLTIKLVGRAKRKLFATGKAKVRAGVTFTPTGGDAATQMRALVLKRALRRPSRR